MPSRKGKGKQTGKLEKSDIITTDGTIAEEQEDDNGGQGEIEENLAGIHADIKLISMDIKSDLNNFRDRIRDDLKK